MSEHKSFKDFSRWDWGKQYCGNQSQYPTDDQIKLGLMQRIAEATEKMAANYAAMQEERDRLRRWHDLDKAQNERLGRRISALRGVITRLKKGD